MSKSKKREKSGLEATSVVGSNGNGVDSTTPSNGKVLQFLTDEELATAALEAERALQSKTQKHAEESARTSAAADEIRQLEGEIAKIKGVRGWQLVDRLTRQVKVCEERIKKVRGEAGESVAGMGAFRALMDFLKALLQALGTATADLYAVLNARYEKAIEMALDGGNIVELPHRYTDRINGQEVAVTFASLKEANRLNETVWGRGRFGGRSFWIKGEKKSLQAMQNIFFKCLRSLGELQKKAREEQETLFNSLISAATRSFEEVVERGLAGRCAARFLWLVGQGENRNQIETFLCLDSDGDIVTVVEVGQGLGRLRGLRFSIDQMDPQLRRACEVAVKTQRAGKSPLPSTKKPAEATTAAAQ